MTKSEKLPAFHFYVGDWKREIAVQTLSMEDRGVWLECLFLMHISDQRGCLVINGIPMTESEIAKAIASDEQTVSKALSNIKAKGICGVREDGAIFSRRMVADEAKRAKKVLAGSKGGKSSKTPSKTLSKGEALPKQNPENEIGNVNVNEDPKIQDGIVSIGKFCQISEIDLDQFKATKGQQFMDRCFEKANAWVAESEPDPVEFQERRQRAKNCAALFQNWVFVAVSEEKKRLSRFDSKSSNPPNQSPRPTFPKPQKHDLIFDEKLKAMRPKTPEEKKATT